MADAQTIDSLAIEITTSVKGEKKLTNFAKALTDLATASQGIDTTNLAATASDLKLFTGALTGVNTNGVKNFANALKRLSEIKSENVGGLDTLARSIVNLTTSAQNTDGLTRLTNSLSRLANAKFEGVNSGSLDRLSTTVQGLVGSLAGAEQVDSGITRLVSAFAKLGSSGQYIGNVTTELPRIGTALTGVIKDLQKVGTIDANITRLVDGIARLSNAGKRASETANSLDKFGDAVVRLVKKLQGVGTVNTNLANTIQGLGKMAESGMKFGNVAQTTSARVSNLSTNFKKLGSVVLRVISPFNSFREKLGMAQKRSKSLASTIGLLYAKYFLLVRGIKAVGKTIKSSQDYIEGFNYFNVALQKIGKDNKKLYKRYGYNDAESYANSFQDRFTSLQKQMTGYDVNSRTGDLNYDTKGGSLGLNITDVMQYQAQVAQITNSTGQLGEVSVTASKAMSMLAADFSSLSNTDLTQVQQNFMSALNGQTRAVYKYGVNLQSASLQQIAYNHGVGESISKLSMASKQQLRLLGMLEQSKVAWGDLGRTINQPANQLRMLQAGFQNLGRTIGSIFLPAIQAIYPVLNGIVMVLQEFFQWIAKLVGAKMPDMSDALKMPEIDMEQPADDTGKIADNTNKAAKNAKQLSDNFQGIDEINKLSDDKTKDPNAGLGGNKGLKDIDLSKDINDLFKKYQKIWDKYFNSIDNKAVRFAKKIKEALLKGWKNGGDFTQLGKDFGKWFSDTLAKIPWAKIQAGVDKLTRSFATFLNGVIYGTDWKTVGNTVAQAFNTIVGALYTWYDTFDFLTFGKNLATGINEVFNKIDWEKLGSMLGKKLRGMIQFAFGLVTNIDFKNIGEKITNAINSFLKDMGAIDPRTGLSGWAELGKTFSDGATGLLDTIITVLEGVDWDAVAKAISDFMSNVDWFGILGKLAKVIGTAIWKLITTGVKAFVNDPKSVGGGLIAILGTMFAWGRLKGLLGIVKGGFRKLLGIGLKDAAKNVAVGNALGGTGGGGLFASLFGKLKTGAGKVFGFLAKPFKALGGQFKAFGADIATKFSAGFDAAGVGQGIMTALKAATIGTAGGTAILATAAVGSGLAIGKMVGDQIDAATEAREAHRSAVHAKGKSQNARGYVKIKDNKTAQSSVKDTAKRDGEFAIQRQKRLADYSQKQTDEAETTYKRRDLVRQGRINNLKNKIKQMQDQNGDYFTIEGLANLEKYQKELEDLITLRGEDANFIREQRSANESLQREYDRQATIQKNLQKLKKVGIITEKQYQKALSEGITKDKDAVQVQNEQIANSKKYLQASQQLANNMSKANVPMEQQKVILQTLREKLANGEISMKRYKDIVSRCGGDVKKLNTEIAKIKPKKKVTISVTQTGLNRVLSSLKGIPKQIPVNVTYNGQQGGTTSKSYKSDTALQHLLGGSYNQLIGRQMHVESDGTIKMLAGVYNTWAKKLKKAGYKVQKVKKFKKGGFLNGMEDGLFTMNDHEIAGRFTTNGKSAVANNETIQEGFATAVTKSLAPAIYAAVKQGMNDSNMENGSQDINVYLDGKQLADNSVKYIRQMQRSNGAKVFA